MQDLHLLAKSGILLYLAKCFNHITFYWGLILVVNLLIEI